MIKNREIPNKEYLEQCFTYDPETGLLYWKHRPIEHFMELKNPGKEYRRWNTRYAGTVALNILHPMGYKQGSLNGKEWKAHRIIFKLINGYDPESVDHIDGNKSNNRIENLRSVTQAENMKNQKTSKQNKTGQMGVHWYAALKKWMAMIGYNGNSIHLGYFDNIEQAIEARKNKEIELGFHANHGR